MSEELALSPSAQFSSSLFAGRGLMVFLLSALRTFFCAVFCAFCAVVFYVAAGRCVILSLSNQHCKFYLRAFIVISGSS